MLGGLVFLGVGTNLFYGSKGTPGKTASIPSGRVHYSWVAVFSPAVACDPKNCPRPSILAVDQNQWRYVGVGARPILEPMLVVGLVDVHWGVWDVDSMAVWRACACGLSFIPPPQKKTQEQFPLDHPPPKKKNKTK